MMYERRASPLHAARAVVAAAWCAGARRPRRSLFEHPLVLGDAARRVAARGAARSPASGAACARMLRFALPFALLIALINPLVVREGLTVIWRFGEVPPFGADRHHARGARLRRAARRCARSRPARRRAADARPSTPTSCCGVFRRVSFRSALTAALAVRLVPVLQRDGAPAGRGAALPRRRRPAASPSLRAVASGALDRAADVAATLEVRGYRTRGVRVAPPAREPWSRHDVGVRGVGASRSSRSPSPRALAGVADVAPYPDDSCIELGRGRARRCAPRSSLVALLPFADRRGIDR